MKTKTVKQNKNLEKKIIAMRQGGKLLADIRSKALKSAKPGINLQSIDEQAEEDVLKISGKPSFKQVPGYHHTTCINVNEGIVHGIPNSRVIKNGDLVSIDIGLYFKGYHTDAANTVIVGKSNREKKNFLLAGKRALKLAIKQAKPKNRVVDISRAIQQTVEQAGYSCSRTLTGHGVGRKLHEEPPIPCIVNSFSKQSPRLKPGQTIAIEVIYTQGSPQMKLLDDGWTLVTSDGKLAAVFEETVLVTDDQPEILTRE